MIPNNKTSIILHRNNSASPQSIHPIKLSALFTSLNFYVAFKVETRAEDAVREMLVQHDLSIFCNDLYKKAGCAVYPAVWHTSVLTTCESTYQPPLQWPQYVEHHAQSTVFIINHVRIFSTCPTTANMIEPRCKSLCWALNLLTLCIMYYRWQTSLHHNLA